MPKVKVYKGAETVQGRKLFKGGNYMSAIFTNKVSPTNQEILSGHFCTVEIFTC